MYKKKTKTVLKTTLMGAALFVLMGAKGEGCIPSDFSVDITHHDAGEPMHEELGAEDCPPGSYAEWVCEAPIEPANYEDPEAGEARTFEEAGDGEPGPGEPGEFATTPGEPGDEDAPIAPLPGDLGDEAAPLGTDDGCEMVCVLDLGEELACPEGTIEELVCDDEPGFPEEDTELTAPIEGEPTDPIEGETAPLDDELTAPVEPPVSCRAACVPVEACPHEEGASHEPLGV